jgi:hypothetical protein
MLSAVDPHENDVILRRLTKLTGLVLTLFQVDFFPKGKRS